jgi:hypothetical protein
MYKELIKVLSETSPGVGDVLYDLGFNDRNFLVEKTNGRNDVYIFTKTFKNSSGYEDNKNILFVEPKTGLFWLPNMTRALMNSFIDNVDEWQPANLDKQFYLYKPYNFSTKKDLNSGNTGLDNKNSVHFEHLEPVMKSILQYISEDSVKRGFQTINDDLISDTVSVDQLFPISRKITVASEKQYNNVLKFLGQGFHYDSLMAFVEQGISYEKLVASPFYDPDLPAELILIMMKSD